MKNFTFFKSLFTSMFVLGTATGVSSAQALKLNVSVSDMLCMGEETVFMIDTTGTGAIFPGAELKVTSTTEAGVETEEKGFVLENGLLKKTISPTETTQYHVSFSSEQSKVDTTVKVTVFNFKVIPQDKVICDGESVELSATVSPAGSKIEWFDEDRATSLGSGLVEATPKLQGSGNKYIYKYWAKPYSDIVTCESTGMTPLVVTVYSNPVIAAIDTSNKNFEVVMNPDFGMPAFTFTLDNGTPTADNVFKGLTNGMHTIKVEDGNGCTVVDSFKVNNSDGVESILADEGDGIINVYTLTGALVKANVKASEALYGLKPGSYIVGNKKVVVKD